MVWLPCERKTIKRRIPQDAFAGIAHYACTRVSELSGEAAILDPRKRPAAGLVQPPGALDLGCGAKA
jgi:hypothetical protein